MLTSAPQATARPPLYVVDGQPLHVATLGAALDGILALLLEGTSFFICTLNLDHLVKLRGSAKFRDVYSQAAIVTPDGFPIVVLARLDGVRLNRITGADLVEPLCGRAAANKVPIYIIGPTEATLEACIAKLEQRYPDISIVGHAAPPYGFDPEGAEAADLIGRVRDSGAKLCFVGLGAPKQEYFCAAATGKTHGVGFIPVGAALEYLAGTKRRAPLWMQNIGMEWLWRFASEPTRLAGRYAESAMLFLRLLRRR